MSSSANIKTELNIAYSGGEKQLNFLIGKQNLKKCYNLNLLIFIIHKLHTTFLKY